MDPNLGAFGGPNLPQNCDKPDPARPAWKCFLVCDFMVFAARKNRLLHEGRCRELPRARANKKHSTRWPGVLHRPATLYTYRTRRVASFNRQEKKRSKADWFMRLHTCDRNEKHRPILQSGPPEQKREISPLSESHTHHLNHVSLRLSGRRTQTAAKHNLQTQAWKH